MVLSRGVHLTAFELSLKWLPSVNFESTVESKAQVLVGFHVIRLASRFWSTCHLKPLCYFAPCCGITSQVCLINYKQCKKNKLPRWKLGVEIHYAFFLHHKAKWNFIDIRPLVKFSIHHNYQDTRQKNRLKCLNLMSQCPQFHTNICICSIKEINDFHFENINRTDKPWSKTKGRQ